MLSMCEHGGLWSQDKLPEILADPVEQSMGYGKVIERVIPVHRCKEQVNRTKSGGVQDSYKGTHIGTGIGANLYPGISEKIPWPLHPIFRSSSNFLIRAPNAAMPAAAQRQVRGKVH